MILCGIALTFLLSQAVTTPVVVEGIVVSQGSNEPLAKATPATSRPPPTPGGPTSPGRRFDVAAVFQCHPGQAKRDPGPMRRLMVHCHSRLHMLVDRMGPGSAPLRGLAGMTF